MKYTVLLHCKPEILQEEIINHPEVQAVNNNNTGQVDLYVDDVPEDIATGSDPTEKFCEHYGVNPSLVEYLEVPELDDERE